MATSKLFNPRLLYKSPGNVLKAQEADTCFVSPPTHAEVPVFSGPTDAGSPAYPLRMSQDSQAYADKPQRHRFVTRNSKGDY